MEPHRADPPEVELLETNRPPGALERAATSLVRHRGVRIVGVLTVAVALGVGISTGFTDDDPAPAAQPEPQDAQTSPPRDPASYVAPPWVTSGLGGWEVLGRPRVNPESPVYVVMFAAVNGSADAQNPRNLEAVGLFEGNPGFRFSARCTGFDNDAAGELRPVRTMVEPGERIQVRCADTMEYSGNRPDLVPRSLRVHAVSE